jgi:hypothetical protein
MKRLGRILMVDDDIDWAWQQMRLRQHLTEIDGDAFESFFQDIGKALWGGGFQATIAMGSRGDLKCDGWRADVGYVYQCYGPRYGQMNVDYALKKVDEDFRGAKDHWKDFMKKWWFVVGLYKDKMPPEVLLLMAQLSDELKVPSEPLHREDIVKLVHGIEASVRATMFGRAPVRQDMIHRVTYENIGRALAFIRADITQSPLATVTVPPNVDAKVAFNMLPDSVRQFLRIGTAAADRVRRYISDHAEPDEAARMAEGFSARYRTLIAAGAEPGDAYRELLIFAGGVHGDPDRDAAALAIVMHFFTTCEIFERPPEAEDDSA